MPTSEPHKQSVAREPNKQIFSQKKLMHLLYRPRSRPTCHSSSAFCIVGEVRTDLATVLARACKCLLTGLDIGCGANCIYPLLGACLNKWRFKGVDITDVAITWAQRNVDANPDLAGLIQIRRTGQSNSTMDPANIAQVILLLGWDLSMWPGMLCCAMQSHVLLHQTVSCSALLCFLCMCELHFLCNSRH